MKKVFIKYNPYKLETVITVDGKSLKRYSEIGARSADGSRLQEWIEEFPKMLVDEYDDTAFEIVFHGTSLDYEDVASVFADANSKGEIKAEIKERIPAKETKDKEALIDDVFKEIQNGPFEELCHKQVISAFQNAKNSDFEVCVAAVMSAGKSTLINAMLGTRLMHAREQACTAIITRIKDVSNDKIPFHADVFDNNNNLMASYPNMTLKDMINLNANANVSEVWLSGNIPFVSSDDISLVLIDTPGPTSNNHDHKKVFFEMLNKSSKPLLIFVMDPQFESEATYNLLTRISKSMEVGGKQSKDRFIFVVNKLDKLNIQEDPPEELLKNVLSYIENVKIFKPNLYPVAALPALNIRLLESGEEIDVDSRDETGVKIKKLNRNKPLHFEKYAILPASVRGDINGQLCKVQSEYNGPRNENAKEALIHTGIVSVEAAIRQYVEKYAKTRKIKNIVEVFDKRLEELECLEKTKREIAKNQEESERIAEQIDAITAKIDSAKEAKKFKDAVDDAVVKVNDDARAAVDNILIKYQKLIRTRKDELYGEEINLDDVDTELERLTGFANKLEPEFEADIDEMIRTNLVETSNALLEEYQNKLVALTEELVADNAAGIKIDPLKLMGGSIGYSNFPIKRLKKRSKKVEDGDELVEVSRKPILGLGIRDWLFGKKKEWRTKYKDVEYIKGDELAQQFFVPVEENLRENGNMAIKYAREQSKQIAERFNKKFDLLDNLLKSKLNELKSYATDKKKAQECIKESERKLKWLEDIKQKVESILEI